MIHRAPMTRKEMTDNVEIDSSKLKKFLENKYTKLIFSIAIMGSAIPSIYQDFTYGHGGEWTHYGMMLVGVLYFIESLLWTLDLWKNESN